MRALPATPTQPAMAVCAPMCTLWPIWIRLSSLTPSSITVSSSAPRSMQVLAPISTSSPMRTRRAARSSPSALVGAKPKPSAPITTPLCRMQRAPITQASPAWTRGASRVPFADHCARADVACAPMTGTGADACTGPT
jgi:hypothetical protein